MKNFIILASVLAATIACKKAEPDGPYPCLDGSCATTFYVDSTLCDAHLRSDGYWHINTAAMQPYFTVKGNLATLNPQYVLNKVPLIEIGRAHV